MKKAFTLLVALALVLGIVSLSAAETIIQPNLDLKVKKPSSIANNPVMDGESPFTGLPADITEYTPILLVYDNNTDGYMHWGIGSADIMIQVPNQGRGNSKMLGLFASEYPEYAGGSRSGRITALPFAFAFDSAFSSANYAPVEQDQISVSGALRKAGYGKDEKWFDLLSNGSYKHRLDESFRIAEGIPTSANLLGHIREMHEIMVQKGIQFEKRPFLFTDGPLDRGDAANVVDLKFFNTNEDLKNGKSMPVSNSTLYYDEGLGYQRQMAKGIEMDRETGEILEFANVIVMRAPFQFLQEGTDWYTYSPGNYVGGGQAEIFQNGRHITGAWYRDSLYSRLIFLDDQGNELKFQRGKTFIVVNDDHCVVSYDE